MFVLLLVPPTELPMAFVGFGIANEAVGGVVELFIIVCCLIVGVVVAATTVDVAVVDAVVVDDDATDVGVVVFIVTIDGLRPPPPVAPTADATLTISRSFVDEMRPIRWACATVNILCGPVVDVDGFAVTVPNNLAAAGEIWAVNFSGCAVVVLKCFWINRIGPEAGVIDFAGPIPTTAAAGFFNIIVGFEDKRICWD